MCLRRFLIWDSIQGHYISNRPCLALLSSGEQTGLPRSAAVASYSFGLDCENVSLRELRQNLAILMPLCPCRILTPLIHIIVTGILPCPQMLCEYHHMQTLVYLILNVWLNTSAKRKFTARII